MSPHSSAKDLLAIVVDSLTKANKALRDVVRIRGDEIGRLEQFEAEFNKVTDKFSQFKGMALNHNKQAEELQVLLNDELNRQQDKAENLRIEISKLTGKIEKQSIENEELELRLKEDVERLQKLKYQNDNNGTYVNALPIKYDSSKFIQRLQNNPHC